MEYVQVDRTSVQLALPETVDVLKNEAAVFRILKKGLLAVNVKIGDVVVINGYGNLAPLTTPGGKRFVVAKAEHVCFIIEPEDMKGE